jgi:uncharacterized coiled-coil protein SlyX
MYVNPTLQMDRGHFLQDQIAIQGRQAVEQIATLDASIIALSARVSALESAAVIQDAKLATLDMRVTQQAARLTALELLCHKFKKKLHMENE